MTVFDRITYRLWTTAVAVSTGVLPAFAQLDSDLPDIGVPDGNGDLKETIGNLIKKVLDFLALIAVIYIIIAGIRLIISQGEEEQKEKAKKSIIYVIVGLIVILVSRIIVGFFTSAENIGLS